MDASSNLVFIISDACKCSTDAIQLAAKHYGADVIQNGSTQTVSYGKLQEISYKKLQDTSYKKYLYVACQDEEVNESAIASRYSIDVTRLSHVRCHEFGLDGYVPYSTVFPKEEYVYCFVDRNSVAMEHAIRFLLENTALSIYMDGNYSFELSVDEDDYMRDNVNNIDVNVNNNVDLATIYTTNPQYVPLDHMVFHAKYKNRFLDKHDKHNQYCILVTQDKSILLQTLYSRCVPIIVDNEEDQLDLLKLIAKYANRPEVHAFYANFMNYNKLTQIYKNISSSLPDISSSALGRSSSSVRIKDLAFDYSSMDIYAYIDEKIKQFTVGGQVYDGFTSVVVVIVMLMVLAVAYLIHRMADYSNRCPDTYEYTYYL
jgi:hypothetical protein